MAVPLAVCCRHAGLCPTCPAGSSQPCAVAAWQNLHCPLFRDDHGFSPLHWACREGRSNVVDMLIMRGARINVMNRGDDTPLHLAASHGHRDIVQKVPASPGPVLPLPCHPHTHWDLEQPFPRSPCPASAPSRQLGCAVVALLPCPRRRCGVEGTCSRFTSAVFLPPADPVQSRH